MRGDHGRSWAFRAVLVIINIIGLIWIHHDLTSTRKPRIRVLAALPSRDVDSTDRFSLVFDEPLPLAGSPTTVLAESPFAIEPHLAGQWVWSAPEKLEYRLARPLPPGRRFTIRPTSQLERLMGRTLAGTSQFSFQTRPLQLNSCRLVSSDRQHVNIELKFNQPVLPADLLRNMRVADEAGGARLEVQPLVRDAAEKIVFRTARPRSNRVNVTLDGRLTGHGAELPLGSPVTEVLNADPVFALQRADVEQEPLNKNACVVLRFSRPLDRKQAKPHIELSPSVPEVQVRMVEDGLRLEGPFECGKRYTVRVNGNLLAADQTPLGESQSTSFEVDDREPAVRFSMREGILSPAGNLGLEIKAVNVAGFQLKAARVHANNLAAHLRGDDKEATSRELPAKTVHLDLRHNEPTALSLDLRELFGGPLGVYHIEAEASDHAWTRDSAVVAVTDLAITHKKERNGACVWVTSLRTARPVAGAEVAAVSYNGQVLAKATTDTSGIARLSVSDQHPDGKVWLITAALGDDLGFLQPDNSPWVIDGVDQSGRSIPITYDVMLYGERGVYRPGDTIHLTGIIRDGLGQVPSPFPLSIAVQRPDGREVARLPLTPAPDRQGMFHADYATSDDSRTGPYRFSVGLPGAKEVLGRTVVLVEEYVPVRIELKAEPAKERFGPGDDVTVGVVARYLFDQPAAGLSLKTAGTYRRECFQSRRFASYSFNAADQADKETSETIPEKQQPLDAGGRATVKLDRPHKKGPGLWRADVTMTVTEQGGRSVSRFTECLADDVERRVGLRMPGGRLVPANAPVPVEWVQVKGSDESAEPGPMAFTLFSVDYDTTLQQVDKRLVWKTVERVTSVAEGEINSPAAGGAEGRFNISCPAPGRYRLCVTDCYSGSVSQIEFDATDDENAAYALAINQPERVEIVLDKDSYEPGSVAKVLVKSPFAGTLLLAVETDSVVDQRVVETGGNTTELDLPINEKLRGGAFITATVVRKVDPSQDTWLPHRAMGMTRLSTDHGRHKLPVVISAPQQARPGQTIRVKVQAQPPTNAGEPAVVHLWAVDEGILLTTSYKTPDPLGYFFAPREAAVTSADIFDDLLPDRRRPAGMVRIGGDGSSADEEEKLRYSAMPARRRAAAVIWRAVAPVGPDGTLAVDLQMPELTGEMRLMAVVADQDRYGSAQCPVTVSAPLLVETSWPRFAAPGDRFDVPVKLFNSTNEMLKVRVGLRSEGPVRIEPAGGIGELTVKPGEPTTTWIHAATTGAGQVKVSVEAAAVAAAGEPLTAVSQADFPVRPVSPLHAESKLLRIKAGETNKIDPPSTFLPGTVRITLSISAKPSVHLQPAIEQLIDYPYGCVEQTTSRLFALLHASDVLSLDAPAEARDRTISDMIEAGVARLWSMQTRSGGIGYWPGSTSPDLWGTTYAADFLVQAQRAGRKIDPRFLEELAKYLQSELDPPTDNGIDDDMRAHICYVLAALKSPQHGWVARLSDRAERLDMAGRSHLAAAWLEIGRKDKAAAVLAGDTLAQTVATTTGGRLTSQVRQEAVLLNVLLDLDKTHAWIPALVERLEKARRNGQWGSTLENASALAAMARYQTLSQDSSVFEGTVRGGGCQPHPFNQAAKETLRFAADGQPIEIQSSGHGDIYISVTTQGLLRDGGAMNYDHQIKVTRRWTDRRGKPVDSNKVKVGDLVFVETTLTVPSKNNDASIENVAVVDGLPAGMEVENPRLSTSAPGKAATGRPDEDASSSESAGNPPGEADDSGRQGTELDKTEAQAEKPDRVEFRDDRVVIFSSADSSERTFRYALRAVTAGSFELPPIQASCMYDAGFASVHAGGRMEIVR